ncbi:MAG: TraR/DksA C4-type zinc finger protein [Actinomycetota bacterium]|nr:TraR/DksA C4-type zinc finger protein [Actinomycetota bacterium]
MNEDLTTPELPAGQRAAFEALLDSERTDTSHRLAGLVRQLDAIVESCALSVSDDEHDPEGATLGFERAQVTALVGQARQHLDAIDKALERLGTGTYGVCETCGRLIGVERLRVHVVARACVTCATGAGRGTGRISFRGSG